MIGLDHINRVRWEWTIYHSQMSVHIETLVFHLYLSLPECRFDHHSRDKTMKL